MSKINRTPLILKSLSSREMAIWTALDEYVVGQDFAKKILISRLTNLNNGLRMIVTGSKPPATLLFVGPTGSGKMHFIKSFAKIIFGNENAFLRVNCTLFSEGMITQQKIDEFGFDLYARSVYQTQIDAANAEIEKIAEKVNTIERVMNQKVKDGESFDKCAESYYKEIEKLNKKKEAIDAKLDKTLKNIKWEPGGNYQSIVVFEGVDEMHPGVINVLREILDSGTFTSGNGVVSFKNCFIFLKCSLLSEDLVGDYLKRGTVGYRTKEKSEPSTEFYKTAKDRVAKMIPLELLKEIGKENIVVFRPSVKKEMIKIIDKKLENLNKIYLSKNPKKEININFTEKLKEYIYEETQDSVNIILGASSIERIISIRICNRLNKIVTTEEFGIVPGDTIEIDILNGEIVFNKITLS
ncbi:MAG: ATPase AAA-2 domain protein [Parcubacteria group bacterium GW2011_GWF2_38_76]|nr:MAG: ATPase AAA-2 domain protein [Parcubacteria group bacterium GW2011_GWF2_38_76]HBM45444.1 hypothetical protein [Patescibacteria group bacterium]